MLKIDENPPVRFPSHKKIEVRNPGGRWCVAIVRPRMEKALAFDMMNAGVEYYLPLYTKISRRKDNNKPRKSILCLFPGYLPVYVDSKETYERIQRSKRIFHIADVKRQTKFIDDLNLIFRVYEMGFQPEPATNEEYMSGTPVVVESGALYGTRGTVVEKRGGDKLLISVEMMGSARITISAGCLKKNVRRNIA